MALVTRRSFFQPDRKTAEKCKHLAKSKQGLSRCPPREKLGDCLRKKSRAQNPSPPPRGVNPRSHPTHRRNMRSMSLICRRLNSLNSV